MAKNQLCVKYIFNIFNFRQRGKKFVHHFWKWSDSKIRKCQIQIVLQISYYQMKINLKRENMLGKILENKVIQKSEYVISKKVRNKTCTSNFIIFNKNQYWKRKLLSHVQVKTHIKYISISYQNNKQAIKIQPRLSGPRAVFLEPQCTTIL